MSLVSMELFHERIIEKIDNLHRCAQRPMQSLYDISQLAEQATEIQLLLTRAAAVKVLDELKDVA